MRRILALTALLVLWPAGSALAQDICAEQRQLQALGFYSGEIDCQYGPGTEAAVRRFQRSRGLHVDGLIGEDTRKVLFGRHTQEARGGYEGENESEEGYQAIDEEDVGGKTCKEQVVTATSNGRPFRRYAEGNARENWANDVREAFGGEWARTKNARNAKMRCWEADTEGDVLSFGKWKCRIRAVPCRIN